MEVMMERIVVDLVIKEGRRRVRVNIACSRKFGGGLVVSAGVGSAEWAAESQVVKVLAGEKFGAYPFYRLSLIERGMRAIAGLTPLPIASRHLEHI
jgi:hypothetical protein